MKIAMIGHKRIPSREGGVEIVVEELATRMAALGHQVTVYNRRGHHVSGKEFDKASLVQKEGNYKGVHICTVPTIDRRGLAAVTSSFFASFKALSGHYDCIHYHAEGPCAMLWLPHLFGIRTIATIHGLDWQRSKWGGFASWYLKHGEKIAAKYADEVIVLSASTRQYFRDTYGREAVLIPNGITKPEVLQAELICEKWGLSKDGYVLFLGRIVPEKGLRYLIHAFRQVDTDKKLVIAGGASDTDDFLNELKRMASGDRRIVFTGFVQGRQLNELYSNAYLFTLPSDLEGMPLSLLEAMSFGNCCIVSDIPECTEVVQDKAIVFQKSNVTDLTAKLQMACDEPEVVDDYKKRAATYLAGRFSWDEIVAQTLELYKGQM